MPAPPTDQRWPNLFIFFQNVLTDLYIQYKSRIFFATLLLLVIYSALCGRYWVLNRTYSEMIFVFFSNWAFSKILSICLWRFPSFFCLNEETRAYTTGSRCISVCVVISSCVVVVFDGVSMISSSIFSFLSEFPLRYISIYFSGYRLCLPTVRSAGSFPAFSHRRSVGTLTPNSFAVSEIVYLFVKRKKWYLNWCTIYMIWSELIRKKTSVVGLYFPWVLAE